MIIAAAIKFYVPGSKYPIIMTGKRHNEIFSQMFSMRIKYNKDTQVQGFMTDDFRFLSRSEAKEYALACGQIRKCKSFELTSEDLW